jgi:H+/gluconate symporter-like permease
MAVANTEFSSNAEGTLVKDNSQKTAIIIGTVAAIAGVAIASFIYTTKYMQREDNVPHLETVTDKIQRCNNLLSDIKSHMKDI